MSEKTAEELTAEIEALKAEKENLANSKRRVEEENAKVKKRAQEAESKLSDTEKKRLEEENKVHDLLKLEREEKTNLLSKYEGLKSKTLRTALKAEVAALAKDAHDVEDILRVVEAKDALKIDEENLVIEGAADFVTKVRELKPHLFAKKRISSNEDNPPNSENGKGETSEEAYQRELKAAKTQKDFDKVRAKYGKLN